MWTGEIELHWEKELGGFRMARKRKRYGAAIKAKVALAAVREQQTTSELASQFGVHANLVSQWKRQLLDGAESVFGNGSHGSAKSDEPEVAEQIGRLKVQLEWLKKKVASVE
jgi:putative transposase